MLARARPADAELLERFVHSIVTARFDGDEAGALTDSVKILGAKRRGVLFSQLIQHRMCVASRGCINVFARLAGQHRAPIPPVWARRQIAAAIVEELPTLRYALGRQSNAQERQRVDSDALVDLLDSLAFLEAPDLRSAACDAITANGKVFAPRAVVVPADLTAAIDAPMKQRLLEVTGTFGH